MSGILSPNDPLDSFALSRGGFQWGRCWDLPAQYKQQFRDGWYSQWIYSGDFSWHDPSNDAQVMTGWGTFISRRFLGWGYASGDVDWQHGPPMPFRSIR